MHPDYRMMDTALRGGELPRVPFYEHLVDGEVIEQVMGYRLDDPTLPAEERDTVRWQRFVRFYVEMGYDYVPLEIAPNFAPRAGLKSDDTALYSRGQRGWVDEHAGPIREWADLENPDYWPPLEAVGDFALFERVGALLPPGMKIIGGFSGGPFEHASFLMGVEPLSIIVHEDPDFADRFFMLIGERLVAGAARLAQLDGIGAYRFGDDLGYKTATIFSPAMLRTYIFPWYRKVVEVVHAAGKPFVLHSCGQLADVMDEIIATGVDAKHSFEDTIMPVEAAKERWGERISLFGGIDVHFLCTATPAEVKERTKRTLDACAPGGRYALGSGNTIANYVPVPNYLAMLEAGREWNGAR